MRSSELASIEFRDAERATVATIQGEVDLSNAERLLDELMARIGTTPWLVIDLTGCSYLDSAGLRMIARVDLRCRGVGSGLRVVVEPGGTVDHVLAMTRMHEVLTVDPVLHDALVAALEDVDVGPPGDEDVDGASIGS